MEVSLCSVLQSKFENLAIEKTEQGPESAVKYSLTQDFKEDEQISKLLKKGLQLTDNRKYEEAEVLFTEIISTLEKLNLSSECVPYLSEAYNNLGLIQYKKVEFNKSLKSYDKSIQLDGTFAPAYYNKGTVYYRLGFYEAALENMKKAVVLQPKNIEFQKGLNAAINIFRKQPWINSMK